MPFLMANCSGVIFEQFALSLIPANVPAGVMFRRSGFSFVVPIMPGEKEEYCGCNVMVSGPAKVMMYLIFGVVSLFADRLIRLTGG